MTNTQSFLCLPSSFKGKFLVYPPTIDDVVGNESFGTFRYLLLRSQEEIEDELVEKGKTENFPTPYDFLFSVACSNKENEKLAKDAFEFFIHQPVTFLHKEKKILIGDVEEVIKTVKNVDELIFLTEDEFFDFQNTLRCSIGDKEIEKFDPDENPRIRAMKAKARYRDKIKAKKGTGTTLQATLESICCMGIGLTPLNIGQLSYAAVNKIVERYQRKEKYDLDMRTLLAGAKKNSVHPEYWIKN